MNKLKKAMVAGVALLSVVSASVYACRGSICAVGDGYIVTCDVDTGKFCSIILL